jgi:hypothetical protein
MLSISSRGALAIHYLYYRSAVSARFTFDVMLSKLEFGCTGDKNRFARSGCAEIRRLPLSSLPQCDIHRGFERRSIRLKKVFHG